MVVSIFVKSTTINHLNHSTNLTLMMYDIRLRVRVRVRVIWLGLGLGFDYLTIAGSVAKVAAAINSAIGNPKIGF